MSLLFCSGAQSRTIENRANVPLSALAAEAGFPLNLRCGGQGACRGCMVLLGAGDYCIAGKKTTVAAGETLEARACKTELLSADAVVTIPPASLLKIGTNIEADFYSARGTLFTADKNAGSKLGVAVDIGTTTVATLLVELNSGKIIARQSAYNQQIELGDNVAARIALCVDDANVKKLQRLIIGETIVPLISKLAAQSGHDLNDVVRIIFSGNTVMSHLALGFSALSIGTIPFEPLTRVFRDHDAPEIGISICPNARVQTVSAIAGYVGGDIVSDLYVAELFSENRFELLVDIGTNGEIVLNDHGKLLSTATAAGPAFEGAGLLHGMRADTGVIEKIICNADDSIDYEVIGDQPPVGLCGSAVIDFMATAFKTGLLNPMGRFDLDRLRAAGRYVALDCHGMNVNACVVVPAERAGIDENILITEFDVSQILKAKAAVYAGIRTLLEQSGKAPNDLDRLVLAGGFAAHLRIENAITLGLLPEIPIEKYDVIGNGSLAGAYAALGVPAVWDALNQISTAPAAVHLAETAGFEDRFIDALAIPNLDPDEFPATIAE